MSLEDPPSEKVHLWVGVAFLIGIGFGVVVTLAGVGVLDFARFLVELTAP